MIQDERAFLTLARARFAQAEAADHRQRQRELDDLRFYAGDQWPPEVVAARAGQSAQGGLPPVPARPCLTINKVREPIHQILNQERQADLGIELVPADDFGELLEPIDETEIQVREGLLRRIQRSSEAADARTWAFARATIAGRGYYGVMTRFVPGKTWDQELYIQRFYNQASVSLDPAHEQPDGSDAEWAFIGTDMPWAQYVTEFPTAANQPNRVLHADRADFRALGDNAPGWFTSDGDVNTRMVRVVEYWYIERTTRTLAQLANGSTAWQEDVSEGAHITETREVTTKQIKWAKLDGTQILDQTDWPGPDLPIIKVLGEELQPYDTERRSEGMVRPARDACQGFNAMVSKWVEAVGYAPLPPFQIAEGQVDGYEAWYQAANVRALPYLPYRTRDLDGNPAGPPTRTNVSTPIEAIAASVQMFDQSIKSTTGVPDPNLGRQTPSVKSGVMAETLIAQSQHGTSGYLDNLQRSIRYEGQIVNNLLFAIYGRPGRLLRLLTSEGESHTVRIGSAPTPMGPTRPGTSLAAIPYQLTKDANFNIVVKVTRAFPSRRAEEVALIAQLLSANPMFMTWFGDLFFKHQDGPGHQQMAERARVMLDPKIQTLLTQQASGESSIPPQLMAEVGQLRNQLQQAEALLQRAQHERQAHELEWQSRLQIAREDREFKGAIDLELARIRAESALAVAEITKRADVFVAERDRLGIAEGQAAAQQHEFALSAADAQHEMALQSADAGHEAGLAAVPPATQLTTAPAAFATTPPAMPTGTAPLVPPEEPSS